ncbi:hypothetical protein C8R42DRAFT_723737 [Lentinula raphanica]|nr:hypothetical protein C8R42DRAFT_723737 [Lentinula raphanica]
MHEGMQILLIRSSPTSSTPVPPDSFESYPPINPGGSNTNIEFIECDTFGHAATKPNEVLAEDNSQPRSKSTQENVGRFGSTGIQGIEGNVLGHNYTGDLHDTVDSTIVLHFYDDDTLPNATHHHSLSSQRTSSDDPRYKSTNHSGKIWPSAGS